MKLDYPKEWYEQRIERDGEVEIGAGIPRGGPFSERIDLGRFVALSRRSKGWNAKKLAAEAGIGVAEILEIERVPSVEPDTSAVFKLAAVFRVSAQRLSELAGLAEGHVLRLREDEMGFEAGSESVAPLSETEAEDLENFRATLREETEGRE